MLYSYSIIKHSDSFRDLSPNVISAQLPQVRRQLQLSEMKVHHTLQDKSTVKEKGRSQRLKQIC